MTTTAPQQMQSNQQQDQSPQISQQIAVYKTHKKLIEFVDKLNPAMPTEYAHIHGSGDNGNGNRVYSLVGLVLLDYSNGIGDNKVRVTANLAPEDIAFLFNQIQKGKEIVDFAQEKIFGSVDDLENGGQVTKVFFKRNSVGGDGQPRRYPWYVEVQNGTALKGKAATGGTYIQANSYQMIKKVGINLNDQDIYKLVYKVMRYIEVWEMTFGAMLLKRAVQLRRQN